MNRIVITTLSFVVVAWTTLDEPVRGQQGNALVYADFETLAANRPVTARGGLVQLVAFQESDVRKSTFKGSRAWTRRLQSWCGSKKTTPVTP